MAVFHLRMPWPVCAVRPLLSCSDTTAIFVVKAVDTVSILFHFQRDVRTRSRFEYDQVVNMTLLHSQNDIAAVLAFIGARIF